MKQKYVFTAKGRSDTHMYIYKYTQNVMGGNSKNILYLGEDIKSFISIS